jgi:uncharacterized membrane protein YfcA
MTLLLPLGLFAGALTTVAGLGGGMFLVLVLAAIEGPRAALAISAPALLAGNVHRLFLFRRDFRKDVGLAFATGALPGSLVGGLLAVSLPEWFIHGLLATTTGLAIARALGWWSWKPHPRTLAPIGFAIGVFCATSSGAGLLVAPVLLSTGLAGNAYVACGSFVAATMHAGRLSGYVLGGSFSADMIQTSALLAVAILAGNQIGERVRRHLHGRASTWIEHGTLVACVTLAVLGLT